jgi:hypothetical protein
VAELLRATGQDWDRRVHRISVLAASLPPAVADRWAADRPGDRDALVVGAYLRTVRTTPADGPAAAARAQAACVLAAQAHPADPTPWIALLRQAHSAWPEVVARDPWNRFAHHEVLQRLSPSAPGRGSLVEMTHFARRSAERAPYGSPLVMLPLAARVERVAHSRRSGAPDFVSATAWREPGAADEIDTALARWFRAEVPPHAQALADLNLLAFALTRTRRTAEAAPVFRRIGRHMTMHPWDLDPDPVGTFIRWRERVGA